MKSELSIREIGQCVRDFVDAREMTNLNFRCVLFQTGRNLRHLEIASTENKAQEIFFSQECCLAKIASNMYEYMYMYLGNYHNESFLVMKFVMNAFHSHLKAP